MFNDGLIIWVWCNMLILVVYIGEGKGKLIVVFGMVLWVWNVGLDIVVF